MADTTFRSLSRPALAWAVSRAVRLAIGTSVVAFLLAATLSGEGAERFATAGYLAAIFAAVALAVQRFLRPGRPSERNGVSAPVFPTFLIYATGIVAFLSIVSAFVSQPSAEAFTLIACFALVIVAVLVRCGTVAALNAMLVRGGPLVAASRYAVVVTLCALVLAALVGGDVGESLVRFALRVTILAAALVAASLLAPTAVGLRVQKGYAAFVGVLDKLARAFVFERVASYAAIAAVAAMIPASLLPAPFAEPFALAAYAAAACAAFGVAMECRRLRS